VKPVLFEECDVKVVSVRLSVTLCVLIHAFLWAQTTPRNGLPGGEEIWRVPRSQNRMPHFEESGERTLLYVDGLPFTVLTVEIPWWDLIYGRYRETTNAYDYLYPAAEKMGVNTLKVPIKWSMVEPKQGVYDFSYVDHVKDLAQKHHLKLVLDWFGHYASGDGTIYRNLTGEIFAPMYVVDNEKTYPRAIDADGIAHHNVVSYDYNAVIDRETAAFRAFMEHIKKIDSQTHTILMIQVENEIAVFGVDRHNSKLWRDHSRVSDNLFKEQGFTDDLKYSAWRLSSNWIRRLTNAGVEAYPLPLFLNFVGDKLVDWMVGGAPSEDLETYLTNCPSLSFVGVNLYVCSEWLPDGACGQEPEGTVDEFRVALARFRLGRNISAITETNSGIDSVAQRLAYIAVGEFGAPLFSPWALTVTHPKSYSPYVLKNGQLANGAFALHDTYSSLSKALPQVSYYAATDKLKVFMSQLAGHWFSETEDVNGYAITVTGGDNGQAIVIHVSDHAFLIIGFRSSVSFRDPAFRWPDLKNVRVERGYWVGERWNKDGEPTYRFNQEDHTLSIELDAPQAIRVTW